MKTTFADRSFVLLVAGLCLLLFVATLSDYGITWDEAAGELYLGDKYFHFFTSLDTGCLDVGADDIDVYSRPDHPEFFRLSGFSKANPHHTAGVGPTLSAVTKHVFYTRLQWLDPIDARHLAPGLLVAVLLVALFFFTFRRLGRGPAVIAILMLATYPRLWAHAHTNVKDVPAAVLLSLTLVCAYRGLLGDRPASVVLAAVLQGLALGAKANAVFVPFIILPPYALHLWRRRRAGRPLWTRPMLVCLILAPFLAAATWVLSWPLLLVDFPDNVVAHVEFLLERGRAGPERWQSMPLVNALATMPEPVLGLLAVGVLTALVRLAAFPAKSPLALLLLLWLTVPVLRASVPRATSYDVNRHWLEFLPAVAVLSGVGGAVLLGALHAIALRLPGSRKIADRAAGRPVLACAAATLVLLSPVLAWSVRNHPHQLVYYNGFAGGLAGAQRRGFPQATDYWGSSYRRGVHWLNENAAPDARLYVGVAEHVVSFMAKTRLRKDIELRSCARLVEDVSTDALGGNEVYLMYVTRPAHYEPGVREADAHLVPVWQITVDGAPILKLLRVR